MTCTLWNWPGHTFINSFGSSGWRREEFFALRLKVNWYFEKCQPVSNWNYNKISFSITLSRSRRAECSGRLILGCGRVCVRGWGGWGWTESSLGPKGLLWPKLEKVESQRQLLTLTPATKSPSVLLPRMLGCWDDGTCHFNSHFLWWWKRGRMAGKGPRLRRRGNDLAGIKSQDWMKIWTLKNFTLFRINRFLRIPRTLESGSWKLALLIIF